MFIGLSSFFCIIFGHGHLFFMIQGPTFVVDFVDQSWVERLWFFSWFFCCLVGGTVGAVLYLLCTLGRLFCRHSLFF